MISMQQRVFGMMKNLYFSFEVKKEISDRVMDAIRECNAEKLYGDIVIFKPDDASIDRLDDQYLRNALRETGIDGFVRTRIPQLCEIRHTVSGFVVWGEAQQEMWRRICYSIETGNMKYLEGSLNFKGEYMDYNLDKTYLKSCMKKSGMLEKIRNI